MPSLKLCGAARIAAAVYLRLMVKPVADAESTGSAPPCCTSGNDRGDDASGTITPSRGIGEGLAGVWLSEGFEISATDCGNPAHAKTGPDDFTATPGRVAPLGKSLSS